jgi:hypothetical protein
LSLTGAGKCFEDFEVGARIRPARASRLGKVESELLTKLVMNSADAGIVRFEHWGVKQDQSIVFEGEREVLIKRRSHWARESRADD